jgi:hypothetical protein
VTTRGDGRRAASSGATAVYVAHPYFGYLYTLNNTFTQRNPAFGNALVMTTNSEGFVDDEFPGALDRRRGRSASCSRRSRTWMGRPACRRWMRRPLPGTIGSSSASARPPGCR